MNAQSKLNTEFIERDTAVTISRWRWRKILLQILVGSIIVGLIFFIWNFTYWLLDIRLLHNQQNDGGEIISVVFNISTSTLTLVSLVTIFVSINGQHRIQRCREILWELMELPYQCWNDRGHFEYKFSLEQGIRQRFLAYKEVLNSGRIFNYIIVFFSFVIITVVSSMITATITGLGLGYFKNVDGVTFIYHAIRIGVVMMLAFGILILSLSRITLIASLPSIEDLIDTDMMKTGIASILFAAITMRVIPTDPLHIRFAFPFQNLEIYPWIAGKFRNSEEEMLILGGPFNNDSKKLPLKKVHIDAERAHRIRFMVLQEFDVNQFEKITYQFELHSKQGTVYVRFEQATTREGMSHDWLHPIEIIPKLAMENQLFKNIFT